MTRKYLEGIGICHGEKPRDLAFSKSDLLEQVRSYVGCKYVERVCLRLGNTSVWCLCDEEWKLTHELDVDKLAVAIITKNHIRDTLFFGRVVFLGIATDYGFRSLTKDEREAVTSRCNKDGWMLLNESGKRL